MKSTIRRVLLGSMAIGMVASGCQTAFAEFQGFGSGIPLESAARRIVPEGVSVDYAPGVDPAAEISWESAKDWKSALSAAVAKKGMRAEFGTDTVLIVKGSPAAPSRPYSSSPSEEIVQKKAPPRKALVPRPEPRPARQEAEVGGGGFVIRPYRGEASETARSGSGMSGKDFAGKEGWQSYGETGQFTVEEGYMLHGTLNAWAEATGWKVVWNSDHDYPIEASAGFSGDFVKASSDLVRAMGAARPQITADYYRGNKVVVISNRLSDEVNQ